LEKEAEQRELELIELRVETERSRAIFCRAEQRAEDLPHELNKLCSRIETGGEREKWIDM